MDSAGNSNQSDAYDFSGSSNDNNVRRHALPKNNEFVCNKCRIVYHSKEEFRWHMDNRHRIRCTDHRCRECKPFATKKGWKRHINYVPHRNAYYCAECLTTFTTKEEFDAHPKHTFAAKPAKATKRNRKPSVQTKVDMAASPRIEFTGHPNYQQIIYFDHSGNQRVKLADLGTGRHGSYLKRTRTSSDLANHNTLPPNSVKSNRKPSIVAKTDMAVLTDTEPFHHPNIQQIIYYDQKGQRQTRPSDPTSGGAYRYVQTMKRTWTSPNLANETTLLVQPVLKSDKQQKSSRKCPDDEFHGHPNTPRTIYYDQRGHQTGQFSGPPQYLSNSNRTLTSPNPPNRSTLPRSGTATTTFRKPIAISKKEHIVFPSIEPLSEEPNKLPALHCDYSGQLPVKQHLPPLTVAKKEPKRTTQINQNPHNETTTPESESVMPPPTFRRGRRNASIGGIGLVPNAMNSPLSQPKEQVGSEDSPPKQITKSQHLLGWRLKNSIVLPISEDITLCGSGQVTPEDIAAIRQRSGVKSITYMERVTPEGKKERYGLHIYGAAYQIGKAVEMLEYILPTLEIEDLDHMPMSFINHMYQEIMKKSIESHSRIHMTSNYKDKVFLFPPGALAAKNKIYVQKMVDDWWKNYGENFRLGGISSIPNGDLNLAAYNATIIDDDVLYGLYKQPQPEPPGSKVKCRVSRQPSNADTVRIFGRKRQIERAKNILRDMVPDYTIQRDDGLPRAQINTIMFDVSQKCKVRIRRPDATEHPNQLVITPAGSPAGDAKFLIEQKIEALSLKSTHVQRNKSKF
eukprot:430535_1